MLNAFRALLLATLRTNHFQRDEHGRPKRYLSLKLDPHKIPDLPLPRPMFEIFVYSPRSRACTCAAGGGPRRPALVGPARGLPHRGARPDEGAGGQERRHRAGRRQGRLRRQAAARRATAPASAEVEACYKTFINGLLDLTDNLVDGEVHPAARRGAPRRRRPLPGGRRRQGHGHLLRHRQRVAAEHGFWLGDAFASGGSMGYDHKKMGITARGAWEASSVTSASSASTPRATPSPSPASAT
jgi:glutamate dehydrogenase